MINDDTGTHHSDLRALEIFSGVIPFLLAAFYIIRFLIRRMSDKRKETDALRLEDALNISENSGIEVAPKLPSPPIPAATTPTDNESFVPFPSVSPPRSQMPTRAITSHHSREYFGTRGLMDANSDIFMITPEETCLSVKYPDTYLKDTTSRVPHSTHKSFALRAVSQPCRRMTPNKATQLAEWRSRRTTTPVQPSPLRSEVLSSPSSPSSSAGTFMTPISSFTGVFDSISISEQGIADEYNLVRPYDTPASLYIDVDLHTLARRRGMRDLRGEAQRRRRLYSLHSLMSLPAPVIPRERSISAPQPIFRTT